VSATEGAIAFIKQLDISKTIEEATAQKPVQVLSELKGN